MWYNKTLSPLEPGESYLLLIDNRIPNNRYVPVVACAGRATWLMQPDRRIATDGCAMTDSGVNDTSVIRSSAIKKAERLESYGAVQHTAA